MNLSKPTSDEFMYFLGLIKYALENGVINKIPKGDFTASEIESMIASYMVTQDD